MMLIAVAMSCFLHHMAGVVPQVKWGTFVDDRLAWSVGRGAVQQLKSALQEARCFDEACGWKWNAGKGCLFGSTAGGRKALKDMEVIVGPVERHPVNLGVALNVQGADRRRDKKHLKKGLIGRIERQLNRIKVGCPTRVKRIRMVKKLIMPKVKWAAQWVGMPDREARKLTTSVERCVKGKVWKARSRALLWKIDLGAQVNPDYVMDWEVVRARVGRLWKRAVDEFEGRQPRPMAEGRFEVVCKRWSWAQVGDGKLQTPEGVIDLGRDSKAALERHAERGWTRWMFGQDNRFKHPCTKAAIMEKELVLDAHVKWLHSKENSVKRTVGLLAGEDHRNYPGYSCMCGAGQPTRQHWMWECSSTRAAGVAVPATIGEKVSGVAFAPALERHLERDSDAGLKGEFQTYGRSVPRRIKVLCATDGSRKGECAGWGLSIAGRDSTPCFSTGGVVAGSDQTSWAAEMEALRKALVLVKEFCIALHVIIDNKVVQEGLGRILHNTMKLPRYGFQRWMDIAHLLQGTSEVTCSWIPSHGKRERWQPDVDSFGDAKKWRELNRIADEAAGDGANSQWARYRVDRQAEAWPDAVATSEGALDRLYRGYTEYLLSIPSAQGRTQRLLDESAPLQG